MMMGQEEVGSDQTQIIKGKRTKRQRSSSTFVVAATTVTSTSSSAGDGGGGRAVSDEYNSAVSSPVTTDCTQEEEDMAICLIMLARGTVLPSPDLIKNSRKTHQKISSSENSNFYVYECKTCNRTFSSFQALGGHRASHKKPRTSTEEKTRLPLTQPKSTITDEGQNSQFKVSGSALPSQASNIISKANKVHECSICGSEFTSGQALGGHMRRHRTATTTAVSPVAAATAEVSRNSTEDEIEINLGRSMEKQRKYLPLDLNLPAPEDDLRESKFQGIVFTATPALIDCHY